MLRHFVTDTNAVLLYFHSVFGIAPGLSRRACELIGQALSSSPSEVKLSIPSVVFLEIYEKWLTNEEFAREFHYEVFSPIEQSPNIEIKPIGREVLENLLGLAGGLQSHDVHDKIILASAMTLNCPLITTDPAIIDYVSKNSVIPSTIS